MSYRNERVVYTNNDALHPASRGKQVPVGLYLHEDDKATLTQKPTSVHRELSV